jgi:hypothetical protein
MNVLGQKLRNTSILGSKLKNAQVVGKKLLSQAASNAIQGASNAEKLVGQAGKAINVAGRQVSNSAGVVDRSLGRLNPYLSGTVLEGVSTGVRDLAKGVQLSAKEARVGGQDLVKLSQRGLAKKVDDKLRKFV